MWCRLSEIIKLISGQDLQSNQYNDEGKGFLYITGASCIENEKLKKNRWTEYPKSISIKNDILISCKGSIGTIAINTEDKVHIARQIMAIRTNSYCYNLFIKILIKNIIPVIQSKSKGVIPGIERKDILDSLVAIPPLSEQKRIAETVETLLELVDSIESDKIDLSELIKKTKAKVLDLAIKGKLVPQDPNDEPAGKLLEKIREEKEKLIKEGKLKRDKNETFIFKNSDDNSYYEQIDDEVVCIDNDLPFEIPDTWRWCRLKDIGTIVGGGTPKTDIKENWENGNIPWLTPADMRNVKSKYVKCGERNITLQGYNSSSTIMLSPNSIVYSSRAPIGYVAITQDSLCTNQGFKSVDMYCKECSNYTYYLLKALTADIVNRASGTTFKEISGSEFGQTFVPIPPLNEQIKIGEKIDDIFQYLDNIESIIKGS